MKKTLLVAFWILWAGLSYAHKDEKDVGKKYHTQWDYGLTTNGADTLTHRHPGGSRYEHVSRNWHSEHHGGGRGHAAAGEPVGWHWACAQDDNGRWHNHEYPGLTQSHRKITSERDYKSGGTGWGLLDGNPELGCDHVIADTPRNAPIRHSEIHASEPILEPDLDDIRERTGTPIVVRTPVSTYSYVHTFPKGWSFQHLPLRSHIVAAADLLELLGDSAIEIRSHRLDKRGTFSTVAKNAEPYWQIITPGYGFIINMAETVELTIKGRYVPITYYLDPGWRLVGVGFDNEFEVVNDLKGWNNITSIGGHGDLFYYMHVKIPATDIVVPSRDDKVDNTTGYLVYVREVVSAAPQIQRLYKMALIWGQVKAGRAK